MPCDGNRKLSDDIAQPIYLADIEARCAGLGDVSNDGAASHQAYDAAVPWGDVVDVIDPLKPPGPWHLLRNDLRVPGNMFVQMPCEKATIGVIAAFT
jgi:hypothetical protein